MSKEIRFESNLPEILRFFRNYSRLTLSELSEQIDLRKSHISECENNRKSITFVTLSKYSKMFGVDVSEILYLAEKLSESTSISLNNLIGDSAIRSYNMKLFVDGFCNREKLRQSLSVKEHEEYLDVCDQKEHEEYFTVTQQGAKRRDRTDYDGQGDRTKEV